MHISYTQVAEFDAYRISIKHSSTCNNQSEVSIEAKSLNFSMGLHLHTDIYCVRLWRLCVDAQLQFYNAHVLARLL